MSILVKGQHKIYAVIMVMICTCCGQHKGEFSAERLWEFVQIKPPDDAVVLNVYTDLGLDQAIFAKIQMSPASARLLLETELKKGISLFNERQVFNTDLPVKWWSPDSCYSFRSFEEHLSINKIRRGMICFISDNEAKMFIEVFTQ